MFFDHLAHECILCDAGQFVPSSKFPVKVDCSLHLIKHLSALDNNISPDSIPEQCIETVHVLICERQWVQFL